MWFSFKPTNSTSWSQKFCSHMIKQKCIQKSPWSFSLKTVSNDSSDTHGNLLTVLPMKANGKNKADISNIHYHKTHITIPTGRERSIEGKYWTKSGMKSSRENSKFCISMFDVREFFRSPTPSSCVDHSILPSIVLAPHLVCSCPWQASNGSGISNISE